MMPRATPALLAALLVAAALVAAALTAVPAAGDWLVTSDGTRIETRGPWQVEGSQVVFTSTDGRLQALRAADVDLEASAAATREAATAPAATPAPAAREPRKPARVWTDDDIPAAAGDDEPQGEAASEEPAEAEEGSSEPIQIQSWSSRESEDGGGLEIFGTVRNTGEDIAASIQVRVRIERGEDEPPFDTRAFLGASALAPGQTTSFRALLPGIYALAGDPTFEVTSEGFSFLGPPNPESPDDEPEEGEGIEGGGE